MDFFGHRQVKPKQKVVALPAPFPQEIDEEVEAVRDRELSDGYSASEPLDTADVEGRQDPMEAQAWEDAGLEHVSDTEGQNRTSGSGGSISPGMMAPMTPLSEGAEVDEDVDSPTASHKHASSSPLANEGVKAQKMMKTLHRHQRSKQLRLRAMSTRSLRLSFVTTMGIFDAGLEELDFLNMDEDECIAGQAEGAGPPEVNAEKLKE
eukprot:s2915_g15.t1